MKKEIKFRGKSKKTDKWVFGYYVEQFIEIYRDVGDMAHYIIDNRGNRETVDPDTVGQFTGLHDKNGNEIYEGDLIGVGAFVNVIYFEEETSQFKTVGYEFYKLQNLNAYSSPINKEYANKYFEKCGNIYDI